MRLLGRPSHDFDFAVPAEAISVARRTASALDADFYVLDEGFDTARVIVVNESGDRDFLDFSSFRSVQSEAFSPRHLGGKGKNGEELKSLESDLRGRDFTINAIAMDIRDLSILDPLNGAADLRQKMIRVCSETALADDPIRILRAVRQAAALEFRIEPRTRKAMKASASLLPTITPERQRDELFKMLDGVRPAACIRALEILGVLPHLLPELALMKGVEQTAPHVSDVWEHTLNVMQQLEVILNVLEPGFVPGDSSDLLTGLLSLRLGRYRDSISAHFARSLNPNRSMRALLFFAALYHDVSKPATRFKDTAGRIRFFGHDAEGAAAAATRARAFNLSNDEIQRLKTIIANHMRFHFHAGRMEGEGKPPSRKAIYRFFRDAGEAGVDLVLLGLADLRGTQGETLRQESWTAALDVARVFLENYWEKPEESVAPPRLTDGNHIMQAYGLQPGPLIGELLEAIREAQAIGKIATQPDAMDFARGWLNDHAK